MLSNCYHFSRQQPGLKSQPRIKSVSCTMTWPSMKNAMNASYALSRSLTLLISHVHSDLLSNFTVSSTLENGQSFFAKLLYKSNSLCGSGSGRIFALPLPASASTYLVRTSPRAIHVVRATHVVPTKTEN